MANSFGTFVVPLATTKTDTPVNGTARTATAMATSEPESPEYFAGLVQMKEYLLALEKNPDLQIPTNAARISPFRKTFIDETSQIFADTMMAIRKNDTRTEKAAAEAAAAQIPDISVCRRMWARLRHSFESYEEYLDSIQQDSATNPTASRSIGSDVTTPAQTAKDVTGETVFLATAASAFDFMATIYLEDDVERLIQGIRELIRQCIGVEVSVEDVLLRSPKDSLFCAELKSLILSGRLDLVPATIERALASKNATGFGTRTLARIKEVVGMLTKSSETTQDDVEIERRVTRCRVYAQAESVSGFGDGNYNDDGENDDDETDVAGACDLFLMLGGDYQSIACHSPHWHVALHAALMYGSAPIATRADAAACVAELVEIYSDSESHRQNHKHSTPESKGSSYYLDEFHQLIHALLLEDLMALARIDLDPWLHVHLCLFYASVGMGGLLGHATVDLHLTRHAISLGTKVLGTTTITSTTTAPPPSTTTTPAVIKSLDQAKMYLTYCRNVADAERTYSALCRCQIEASRSAQEAQNIWAHAMDAGVRVGGALYARARRFVASGSESDAMQLLLLESSAHDADVTDLACSLIRRAVGSSEARCLAAAVAASKAAADAAAFIHRRRIQSAAAASAAIVVESQHQKQHQQIQTQVQEQGHQVRSLQQCGLGLGIGSLCSAYGSAGPPPPPISVPRMLVLLSEYVEYLSFVAATDETDGAHSGQWRQRGRGRRRMAIQRLVRLLETYNEIMPASLVVHLLAGFLELVQFNDSDDGESCRSRIYGAATGSGACGFGGANGRAKSRKTKHYNRCDGGGGGVVGFGVDADDNDDDEDDDEDKDNRIRNRGRKNNKIIGNGHDDVGAVDSGITLDELQAVLHGVYVVGRGGPEIERDLRAAGIDPATALAEVAIVREICIKRASLLF